jgi:thiol-disulfide isomerase/thioredoxin
MNKKCIITAICISLQLSIAAGFAQQKENAEPNTVAALYPTVTSGVLTFAKAAELSKGIALRAGDITISMVDISLFIQGQPPELQDELNKNALFVLEHLATPRLLLNLARKSTTANAKEAGPKPDQQIIQDYFEKHVFSTIEVTDAEAEEFYRENKNMFGGATLAQVREQIKPYLLGQKKQKAAADYIRTVGKKIDISVSASWLKKQAALTLDNPVDKARNSGRPSLADFGATGCVPCDMLAPILKDLEAKYKDKLNVLFVHVREKQILAARYGVETIPVQIFFDKTGKEVFRHIGFFSQEEIEKKLTEMGVK